MSPTQSLYCGRRNPRNFCQMGGVSQQACESTFRSRQDIGFVSQKSGAVSPLLLWRLPKAHTSTATVLVDELDSCSRREAALRS